LHTGLALQVNWPTSGLKLHDWPAAPHAGAVLDPHWKPSYDPQ
jgi:hypothetical protein